MRGIRPFEAADLPAIVALRRLLFPRSREQPADELEQYFRRIYLAPPWPQGDPPSLVYVDPGGAIAGFVGVIPRIMRRAGQTFRVAVVTNLMVHPESRGVPGLQLLRHVLEGAQDLSLTDRANATARGLWEVLGGVSTIPFNLYWTHALHPVEHALRVRVHARWAHAAIGMGRPLWRLGEAALGAWAEPAAPRHAPPGTTEALEIPWAAAHAEEFFPANTLHPTYAATSLEFMLHELARKTTLGTLRAMLVRDADGAARGWFIYYARPQATSHVVQVVAEAGAAGLVFDHAIHAAARDGATELQGRVQPLWLEQLGGPGFRLRRGGPLTLMHARDPAVLALVLAGRVYFSRLDGEWWLNF